MSNDLPVKDEVTELVSSTNNLNLKTELTQNSSTICDHFVHAWIVDNVIVDPCRLISLPVESSNKSLVDSERKLHSFGPFISGTTMTCSVHSVTGLTSGNAKVVNLIHLKAHLDSPIHFNPGDCIGLFCQNNENDVNWLLDRVDLSGVANSSDDLFLLQRPADYKRPLPAWFLPEYPVSARFLLTHCCDLYVPVTKKIIRLLANSIDPVAYKRQRVLLLELSSREGQDVFNSLIRNNQVTLMDLLHTYPQCRIPLLQLVELLPRLQPRPYTLVNLADDFDVSTKTQNFQFIVTRVDLPGVAVDATSSFNFVQPYPNRCHGVSSGWLDRIVSIPDARVDIYQRQNVNRFVLPTDDPTEPLVMIAAGSGIAPFVSFLRKRQKEMRENPNRQFGLMWLIFGCRSFDTSLLFKADLAAFLDSKVLNHLCLCFSRDSSSSLSLQSDSLLTRGACLLPHAKYVQDCIWSPSTSSQCPHTARLLDLVCSQNARIMVCGEPKGLMPSVQQAWVKAISVYLCKNDNCDLDVGREFVTNMIKSHRYQEDSWT